MVVDCNRLTTIPCIWRQSFRDVPDAFLLRGGIIVNTSYLGCWGPLFEWWQLGDVNPVRWNSFTDLHLNLAEKRFKISLFKSAIWGICCKPSSQVHSDWRRLLHMLIERRRMFGFSWFERINPYSPSTASGSSGFSRDHTFRSIENLTDALHPLKCRPLYFQFFTSLTCNEEPQTRYMGTTLTLKKGIANSIWPLWMLIFWKLHGPLFGFSSIFWSQRDSPGQ